MVDKNDSQDTLANDDDAHKAVLCALSLILCDSLLFLMSMVFLLLNFIFKCLNNVIIINLAPSSMKIHNVFLQISLISKS